jgi:hypothetical protein
VLRNRDRPFVPASDVLTVISCAPPVVGTDLRLCYFSAGNVAFDGVSDVPWDIGDRNFRACVNRARKADKQEHGGEIEASHRRKHRNAGSKSRARMCFLRIEVPRAQCAAKRQARAAISARLRRIARRKETALVRFRRKRVSPGVCLLPPPGH